MELKETNSAHAGSYRSKNKKLMPIIVKGDSRRGSIDGLSAASSNRREFEDSVDHRLDTAVSGLPSVDRKHDSRGSTRSIPVESNDPTQVKKSEFGDSRPLVRDVWSHYPFQEAPPIPKDPREFLNKVLNRKSTFAPKKGEKKDDESTSSNEEIALETENACHFAMFPQLPPNRPSSAHAKIDSQTKLKEVEDETADEYKRAMKEGIDLTKHLQDEKFNFDSNKGRFLRTDDDRKEKRAFKINRQVTLKGVMNEDIWKRVPVSPHLDNYSAKPLEGRKPALAGINPLHSASQGRMSLHSGTAKKSANHEQFNTQAVENSASNFGVRLSTDIPFSTKTRSTKGSVQKKIAFNPAVFNPKKSSTHGIQNLLDMGVIKNSTEFSHIAPIIKDLESAPHFKIETNNQVSQLKRKPSDKILVNLRDRRNSTGEGLGLKRRSISKNKDAQFVITTSIKQPI